MVCSLCLSQRKGCRNGVLVRNNGWKKRVQEMKQHDIQISRGLAIDWPAAKARSEIYVRGEKCTALTAFAFVSCQI